MALQLKDRVLETCSSPGTGNVTLLGASTGYQSFNTALTSGSTTYYTIADQGGANWEVGIGTFTSPATLARNTVLSSSNAGSTVNFSSGTQNVWVDYPSERAVYVDAANSVVTVPSLTSTNDSTINTITVGLGGGASTTNTALGWYALSGNTGTSNTAIGSGTLSTSNQGNWNTAIGTYTLAYNSTGVSNVGMGRMALQFNTTGSNNTAVGGGYYGILNSNTTGSWNTGIGDGALTRNSTAYYNTGIGGLSLNVTTTSVGTFTITGGSGYTNGTYNNVQLTRVSGSTALSYPKVNITVSGGAVTAVTVASINWPDGGECFQDTTTVMTCSNTLIGGTGSGFSVTPATLLTAQNNSGFGYASGYRMYSGSNNTIAGVNAAYNLASGSNNVFFGYQAGYSVTSGSNNVIIGSYQGSAAPISATGSNYIVLSDGSANIREVWNSSGALGIGSTPSYGTSGQVLTSGGSSAAPTWTTPAAGTVTSITAGTGLSGGTITSSGTIAIDATVATLSGTQTLTNKWVQQRVLASTANSATPTLNTDNYDMMVITGQSATITSFTTNLTGTPVNGQKLWIAITGTGSIGITWGASFESSTVTLPSTTSGTARLDIGFVWNVATSKWRCLAVA